MIINRSNVIDLVRKCALNPDKDYGQNFLLEEDVCKRIVDSLQIDDTDNILEIGPGIGSLSHFLSLYPNKISLVDIDTRMIDFLKIHYSSQNNISLINNDVRKEDVSAYTKVIANLPYNITTELIVFLLQNAKKCKKYVLMCQAETFAHFQDISGKEYGPVSVLIHLLGDVKRLFNVKAGSFYPVPKCNSTVFEITINKTLSESDRNELIKVYGFTKQLFMNRRKTILNNLNQMTHQSDISKIILLSANIPENKRPEEISSEKYIELYKLYKEINIIK